MQLFHSEEDRLEQFPVARERIFVAHAAVTAIPRCTAEAMNKHIEASCRNHQEFGDVLKDVADTRQIAADFIGAKADEIALIGPTSLGLSLFANGIEWHKGDEIVLYHGDYPSNVYPWMALQKRGVQLRYLKPEKPGKITPELVESALTPQTRLVALASCHFLTGWRIDINRIGSLCHERNVLFSLDAIQTFGAFETPVQHVDFLSADAHKWMLGPMASGIVYVSKKHFDTCTPILLGAWNVESPNFITQDAIHFVPSARRYEPGALNITGIYGMRASLQMLSQFGSKTVSTAILANRDFLHTKLLEAGFETISPPIDEPLRCGTFTCRKPTVDSTQLFAKLDQAKINASLRQDANGTAWIRFSPHFYNTLEEMQRIVDVLK